MIHWSAEWEEQAAVWFSWPHRGDTWQGRLTELEKKFALIVRTAARFQQVHINAPKHCHLRIKKHLIDCSSVTLHDHATNDVWCRDHGATFVHKNGKLHAIDWRFNAWGGKFPPWDLDDQVAEHMAKAVQCPRYRSPLFLEGGAIEGNGSGLVLTTEAVALNPNRNPDWSKQDVEKELKQCLGCESVFWLPKGIEGDDTDGHIDDLTRFVMEDVIVTAVERDSSSPNYWILEENKERLQDLKTCKQSKVEIIDLPMPAPIRPKDWRLETLPASYANFLILNGAVLVPLFRQEKADDWALGVLRECFPKREVIGIFCDDIIFEGGAIHCLSQQQPALHRQ